MMSIFVKRDGEFGTVDPVTYWDHVRLTASEIDYCDDLNAVREYVDSWRQWVVIYDYDTGPWCERPLTEEAPQFEELWAEYVDDVVCVYAHMNNIAAA